MDYLVWHEATDAALEFYAATSVDYVLIDVPASLIDGRDHTRELRAMRERVERHGLTLHALGCGDLPRDHVLYGREGRDAQIDAWCAFVQCIGAAGIGVTGTSLSAVGTFRTDPMPGRGGALYSTWDKAAFVRSPRPSNHRISEGGPLSAADLWSNCEYLLERLVPVAERSGVRIAIHPDDPPTPMPLGGAARIMVSIDSYRRLFRLVESKALGMLLCQGCVAEMGESVSDVILEMGKADRIVYVHFRNVRGSGDRFCEVFVDEGDVDMVAAMRAYRDVQFCGALMMDHTPLLRHPSGDWAGRAYANGYIRGLIDATFS